MIGANAHFVKAGTHFFHRKRGFSLLKSLIFPQTIFFANFPKKISFSLLHFPKKCAIISMLSVRFTRRHADADIAQLVERILGKDEVTSSNLVISSTSLAFAGLFSCFGAKNAGKWGCELHLCGLIALFLHFRQFFRQFSETYIISNTLIYLHLTALVSISFFVSFRSRRRHLWHLRKPDLSAGI